MKAEATGNVIELFGTEKEQRYWKKCFDVCPMCGGKLEYRYHGAFTLDFGEFKMPTLDAGFQKGHFKNINVSSRDRPRIYSVDVRCTTEYGEFDGCPFHINFERGKYQAFASIDSGVRVYGMKMSAYLDSLVDRDNSFKWRPGYDSKVKRIDKSKMYWRVQGLSIDGMRNDPTRYVNLAYRLMDELRIARHEEDTAEYGKKKESERLEKAEEIVKSLIPELKDIWKTKDVWNRDRDDWKEYSERGKKRRMEEEADN